MYGYFTEEQQTWIEQNIDGKYYKDVVSDFNKVFGTDLKVATFRYRCVRDGLRLNGEIGGLREFSDEQDIWLRENVNRDWKSVVSDFNKIFGTSYNREKIRKHVSRYLKINTSIPRSLYQTQKPLYSKKYNAKDDCIMIKVNAEIGNCKWVPEHFYVWEKAYGKIPKGSKLIHLNGDRTDNRLENLYLVSNSVMISANKTYNWNNENPTYRLCALKNSELKISLDRNSKKKRRIDMTLYDLKNTIDPKANVKIYDNLGLLHSGLFERLPLGIAGMEVKKIGHSKDYLVIDVFVKK